MSNTTKAKEQSKENEAHPFANFKQIIDIVSEEKNRGFVPHIIDAEPRLSGLSELESLQKRINKRGKTGLHKRAIRRT